MNADVRVAGVGMAQFVTPKAGKPYEEMGAEAIRRALWTAASSCTMSVRPLRATSTATRPAASPPSTRSA